ncbi:MAG TPA: ABC transporter permease [Dictyobacter sp.]|nr:ABC transporter permease [Dictyobacter sp.]
MILDDELGPEIELTPALIRKRRSQTRIIFDRFMRNKAAVGGAIFILLLVMFCFLGPFITGHNQPDLVRTDLASLPPSFPNPFGTDDVGRDQLARVMAGGRVSLLVGLSSMLVALIFGVGIGAFAGYYGGLVDNALMRVTDVALAVPSYLLLFVLSIAFANGSPINIVLLIAVLSWASTARLVRSEFLSLKEREYVLAARTMGAGNLRLMFRHILPNAAGPIIVSATLLVGGNIIFESVLSYFGFGIRIPLASWGNMVAQGQPLYDVAPWLVFAPAFCIFFTVLSFNLVGDGLRDALDPYMTER